VIDIWKRSSRSKTITSQTFPFNSKEKILFNKIIDHHLLDQSISCYNLNDELLLIEFNNSKFRMLNHIYNLTIFDNQNHRILTDYFYSSFIYYLKEKHVRYQIKLMVSTIQSEYLGQISKYCEDFYPIYSPFTCLIKSIQRNEYQLIIHSQLSNYIKHIKTLQPIDIFYQINQTFFIKKNIYHIHQVSSNQVIIQLNVFI
jgi:hypothetical protein